MRAAFCLALSASLLLGAGAASAQPAPAPDNEAKAKMLFDAGAQAYGRNQFAAALEAFNEAYRLSPRPGIVFSIAQAHKRQFYLTKKPEHLRDAIRHYREYAARVQTGGRLADVADALAELEPLATRLDASSTAGAPTSSTPLPVEPRTRTQVTVFTQVKGAVISLDGAAPVEMPLIQKEVKPGPHTIKVTAEGYIPYEREFDIAPGDVIPFDAALREQPAQLTLLCQPGAEVSIDGRLVAMTPLLKPLDVPAGRRFVAVTKGGHKPFAQDVDLSRGEKKTIQFKLEATVQRIASFSLLVGSGVAVVGSAVFAAAAFGKQAEAQFVLDDKKKGNIDKEDVTQYNDALVKRDDNRRYSGIALGVAGAFGAAGLLLYVFDQPPPVPTPMRLDDSPSNPGEPSNTEQRMEVTGGPVWLPGYMGASMGGRF